MAAYLSTDENFNVEYNGVIYVMNPEQVTRLTNDPKSIDDIIAENSLRDTGSNKEMVACSKSQTSCSTANSNSSSIGSTSSTCMSKEATLLLIERHRKYQDLFNKPSTKKKSVWEKIASDLSELEYGYTWIQLKNKWNNLLLNYRKTKDANNKTGNSPKTCPYYEELDDYLGCRPNVEPVCLMSSMKKSQATPSTASNSENPATPSSEPIVPLNNADSNDTVNPTTQPKRKRQRITTLQPLLPRTEKVLAVLEAHETSRKEDNQKLLEEMKTQHNEQMKLEKEKLEVEKAKIDIFRKLLENK